MNGSVNILDIGYHDSDFFSQVSGSFAGLSSKVIVIKATIPISEWAGSGTVNLAQNDVEYASNSNTTYSTTTDSTSFAYGPNGQVLPSSALSSNVTRNVQFQYPIQTTDYIRIEISSDLTSWTPVGQWSGGVTNWFSGTSTDYGIGWSQVSATQIQILISRYRRPAGTWDAAGADWSGTKYYRVVKAKAGAAVGFGAFQAASSTNPAGISGLVPALGLPGRTDGVAVAAGYVGEVVTSGQLGGAITISNSIAALGSQLLHAGSWLIIATTSFNGTSGNTYFGAYLGTTTASSTGTTQGETAGFATVVSASGVGGTITLSKTVNISADTTYYLNCVTSTGTAGSGGILGNIKAVRIV
jgi:hypothetical protein